MSNQSLPSPSRAFRFGKPSQQVFQVAGATLVRSGNPERIGLFIQNIPMTNVLASQNALAISFGNKITGYAQCMLLYPGEKWEFSTVPTSDIWLASIDQASLAVSSTVYVGALLIETVRNP